MPGRRSLLPRLALLGSTAIWGTSFVIVQKALEDIPVFHLIAYRFAISTLLLLPLVRRGLGREGWSPTLRRDGAVIGVLLFAGFVLQTLGLLWTTPSRSAFLTALSVILVPILGVFVGRPLRWAPAVGSACAAAGLWFLFRPDTATEPFNRGDAVTLASAVIFAAYVLRLESATRRNPMAPLAVVQFGVVAALALPSLLLQRPEASDFTGYPLFAIVVMSVFATALAFVAQLYAQRHLSAVEAGVILTLEPVIAAGFSVLLRVEPWTSSLLVGGALILAAMLVTELGGAADESPPPVAGVPRA